MKDISGKERRAALKFWKHLNALGKTRGPKQQVLHKQDGTPLVGSKITNRLY